MNDPKSPPQKPPLQFVPKNAAKIAPRNAPPQNARPSEPALFTAHAALHEPRNFTPLIAGFVLVFGLIALIAILGRGKTELPKTADPYSPMLVVERATVSQADNFVGSTVTYIDLTTRNTGDRIVVGGVVHAVFRDTLGQPVQTETLPMRALLPHALGGEQEAADLAGAPLGPGQTRVLRLTVEHISSEWNQTQPDLEFRGLRFK
jgi:hypothetical protein